jgi:alkanesulfonate monooxygenase SsuD/methylene tetrahydromethanopterin reductase-like flavin-dependent oxidoreductase (luciferase family)
MRFMVATEAETPLGTTHHRRYKEVLEEAKFAEEMGFHTWGTSEQHFMSPVSCVSAPEVLYGAVAALTSRIRIRHAIVLLPFAFNHPLRVAERIATLDIVSDGRAELGVGRGNHLTQLGAFGGTAEETRPQMLEAVEIIQKALSQPIFSHDGELLQIPEVSLCPRPVQQPFPPMFMVATSLESHRHAGRLGIGVLSNDNWMGWEHLQKQADAFNEGRAESVATWGYSNRPSTMNFTAFTGYIGRDEAEAVEIGGPIAFSFLGPVLEMFYEPLAEASPSYAYMKQIRGALGDIIESRDVEALIKQTPNVLVGTAEQIIEKVERLELLGYDDVGFRIDGHSHEGIMEQLELWGKYVIPHFTMRNSVVPKDLAVPGRVG